VPVRPEGLPGDDSFAVYAGDVRAAGDLSQATPPQCTAPAGRAPVAGEQLTVADTCRIRRRETGGTASRR
jgi:hypothetical protein